MRRALAAVLALSCGGKETRTHAYVTIDAAGDLWERVASIWVRLENGDEFDEFDLPIGAGAAWPRSFVVFLSEERDGTLIVDAVGSDAADVDIARGQGEGTIRPGGRVDIDVLLEPSYDADGGADGGVDGGPGGAFGDPCGGGGFGPCAQEGDLVCVRGYEEAPFGVCGSNPGCAQATGTTADSCVAIDGATRCFRPAGAPASMTACVPTCATADGCGEALACDFSTVRWSDGMAAVCVMPRCDSDEQCTWFAAGAGGAARCVGAADGDPPLFMCVTTGIPEAEIGDPCTTPGDCPENGVCVPDPTFPGGYCVRFGCAFESIAPAIYGCPDGSGCFPLTRGEACQLTCTDTAECRAGYECCGVFGSGSTEVCTPPGNCT